MARGFMLFGALLLVSLTPSAEAINMRGAAPHSQKQIVPNNVPYKQRCPAKKNALVQVKTANAKFNSSLKVPGTGMSPAGIKAEFAAAKVYKDGYYSMGCIKDYMFYKGDKFGDNKYDYELEKISNVSIVFPVSYVAKEDQVPMTVGYCYGMCRQLENMNFFGIVNGIDCYCAPYVKPMAGDTSTCTAVCDGDKGAICGSKTKSSVFQMHSCDDTSEALSSATTLFKGLQDEFDAALTKVSTLGSTADSKADAGKAAFGEVGDPEASNVFQAAEDTASKLNALATKATALKSSLAATTGEAESLIGKDFSLSENADTADSLMTTMAEQTMAADKVLTEMTSLAGTVSPTLDATGAAEQYYPIMYFINKKFENASTTCSGELLATYVGLSKDACAKTCDNTDVSGCMSFLYVPGSFCFTFSKITGTQYYTKEGCAASEINCYGKLSKLGSSSPLDKEKGQKAVEADSRCMPESV
mmetsp:Transcript_4152/g.7340  ORF Transcript_4152/g.7340 Transcript_4152/m.7340 type:complete len:473 (+) Transcript_4152:75-1493(+)